MAGNLQATLLANLDRVLSEPDASKREEALRELWDLECQLVDPQGRHKGIAVINDNFSALHRTFPGCRFVATSPVQEQFGVARMSWICRSEDKGDIFSGMDFCVGREGKILSLYAFRDEGTSQ